MTEIIQADEPMILPVPTDKVLDMWPWLKPHLMKVVARDDEFDALEATRLVLEGLTQIWAVFVGKEVVGAFATTIVQDGDHPGELALDIHGLGGERFKDWKALMADLMIEWGTANKCHRITFRGRKCLIRSHAVLGDIQITGHNDQTDEYYFERRL